MVRIADSHSDFASYNILESTDGRLFNQASLESMLGGGVTLQVFAAWVPSEYANKLKTCYGIIDFLNRFIVNSEGIVILCKNKDDVKSDNALKALLSIESGDTIECRAGNIEDIYKKGVRMLSLTWNDENAFASGAISEGGLKKEGVKAVMELNRLNMSLDVSHLNEQGFWEAVEVYRHSPCASHSCTYSLAPNPRNLKDEQIKLLIEHSGYIGVNFYTEFLRGRNASIDDILEHIEHILSLGGEDCVGLGSDFCGIQYTPDGLESAADFQKIPEAMKQRGYDNILINKICYGNFERYILKFL